MERVVFHWIVTKVVPLEDQVDRKRRGKCLAVSVTANAVRQRLRLAVTEAQPGSGPQPVVLPSHCSITIAGLERLPTLLLSEVC